jgi:hypothetical protein
MLRTVKISDQLPIWNDDFSEIIDGVPYEATVETGPDNEYGPHANIKEIIIAGEVAFDPSKGIGVDCLVEALRKVDDGFIPSIFMSGIQDSAVKKDLKERGLI